MAKRKLTRRQKWRIRKIQEDRLARAQRHMQQNPDSVSNEPGLEQTGRVTSNFGKEYEVEDRLGHTHRCYVRQNLEDIVCGDNVIWHPDSASHGIITALQPRRSLLSRPDFHQESRPVAANIDLIVVVSAIEPPLNTNLIDRYLVAVETVAIEPLLVINKCDLLTADSRRSLHEAMECYRKIGYRILYLNTREANVMQPLVEALENKTSIFVGQSGVGKSSIIQALLPEENIRIGKLSDATGHGRHTTSVTRLYHFPSGGELIDSPGVRDFALWNVSRDQVLAGFREFRDYLGKCRFHNCSHRVEPQCAIIDAVEQGHICAERLQSYYQILDSLEPTRSPPREPAQ